jgi:hypothetical protein
MKILHCPNYDSCKLVHLEGFIREQKKKKNYIENYCLKTDNSWKNCKRYIAKDSLSFCPDFVLPDTGLSMEEIVAKFDELDNQ